MDIVVHVKPGLARLAHQLKNAANIAMRKSLSG